MKRMWAGLLIPGILAGSVGCGDGGGTGGVTPPPDPPDDGTTLITMSGTQFSSADVTIEVGETVRWENRDGQLHTVTPDGHSEWASTALDATGEQFEHTFHTAGTYEYYCQPHESVGMTGVIRVQ